MKKGDDEMADQDLKLKSNSNPFEGLLMSQMKVVYWAVESLMSLVSNHSESVNESWLKKLDSMVRIGFQRILESENERRPLKLESWSLEIESAHAL